jgi:glycosyltransferase involved in cell wall biosynthesis
MYAIVVNEMNIRGGTHKQVLRLCQYLKRNNIKYVLYTRYYNQEETYMDVAKLNIRYISKYDKRLSNSSLYNKIKNVYKNICEQMKLYRMLDADCRLINVHDNGLLFFMFLCKMGGKKIIWQVNDLPSAFHIGASEMKKLTIKGKIRGFISRLCARIIAQNVDEITVNVTKNRNRVNKYFHRDSSVFYCGTDLDENVFMHHTIKNKNNIHLLSTGVFFVYRNYETLIKTVQMLRGSSYNVHLDIIGSIETDKRYYQQIKDMIKKYNLNEYITIWGQVDEKTFCNIYDDADIFLFINLNQSWGLAVFEAMSRGLPVVVSNSVGAIELLHNEEDSIIVDPMDYEAIANKIIKLMDDNYYKKISGKAIENAYKFTWDKLYNEKMYNLFQKVIER